MAWRQRIYAFLLRRILGPYLAPSSSRKLHRCVEVSLTEGRFVLTDVDLDPARLNTLLFSAAGDDEDGGESPLSVGVRVRRAVVRKLGIHLSLREGDEVQDDGDGTLRRSDSDPSESLTVGMAMDTMSKAYRLSYTRASEVNASSNRGGVALLAHIEIEGLEIDLAPVEAMKGGREQQPNRSRHSRDTEAENSSSRGGYISSYVDAALASLRLTLSISDVSIRALDQGGSSFAALRLSKVSYRDEPASARNTTLDQQLPTEEAVLQKSVDFDGLSIEVGTIPGGSEDDVSYQHTIARTDGLGNFSLRATVVHDDKGANSSLDPKPPRIQREIDATLCERLSFSVDTKALGCLASVLRGVKRCTAVSESSDAAVLESDMFGAAVKATSMAPDVPPFALTNEEFSSAVGEVGGDDRADANYISEIMRQYAEARHLARTREVRGGMLLPSFSFNESDEGPGHGDAEVAFDMFFDANEQSFHHYRSMVSEASGWKPKTDGSSDANDENDDGFVRTKLALRLPCCSLRCLLEGDIAQAENCNRHESMVTIVNCAFSMSLLETGLDATCSVSHFAIEDSVLDSGCGVIEAGHLLRFLDPPESYQDAEIDDPEGTCIVSSAPCLSVDIVKRRLGDPVCERRETEITITLDPLELNFRHEAIGRVSKILQFIRTDADNVPEGATTAVGDDPVTTKDAEATVPIRIKATCPALTVFCPVAYRSSNTGCEAVRSQFDPLFDRIGYQISSTNSVPASAPGIGFTFDEVSFGLSVQTFSEADNDDDLDPPTSPLISTTTPICADEMTLDITCQNAILFSCMARNSSDEFTTRADIVAFQGESNIDSAALVRVQYKSVRPNLNIGQDGAQNLNRSRNRNSNSFPLVPPLSAVKATQPDGDGRLDDVCPKGKRVRGDGPRKHRGKRQHQHVRASDPQYTMSAEAAESNCQIDMSVPSIAVDLTTKERVAFFEMITALQATRKSDEVIESSKLEKKDPLCLSLHCRRLSVTLHGTKEDFANSPELSDELDDDSANVSYIVISDGMRLHTLFGVAGGLRNIRVCSQDITLYEVFNILPNTPGSNQFRSQRCHERVRRRSSVESTYEKCCQVRKRSIRNESTREARPIVFRQKLYRPLSPETSALILDVLNRNWGIEEDDDDEVVENSGDIERSIFFSMYDMTYRCDINSHWRQRLIALIQGGAVREDEQGSSGVQQHSHTSPDQEERSLLTNIFITLSDCTLDYTSPLNYTTPSRSLLRFGEIRLTGNRISPPAGPTQMYKLSVADFEHHLCNHRVPFDAEDSRLSCSGNVLQCRSNSGKIATAASVEDAARGMGFITVATLDSADVLITLFHETGSVATSPRLRANHKPDTTLVLSLGRICLYTCRDSFACFTDSFSEWIADLTTPSGEDVARLKQLPVRSNDDSNVLLGDSVFNETVDKCPSASPVTNKSISTIPDNELSAAELREKHGLAQNGISQGVSSALFSKDFGGLHADSSPMLEERSSPNAAGLLPSYPSERSDRGSVESECQLGGHGWTTVDHEWAQHSGISPGQEQSAKWLTDDRNCPPQGGQSLSDMQHVRTRGTTRQRVQVVQHHIPKDPGVMFGSGSNAAKSFSPKIKLSVVVRDMSLNFRFFDGYDWMDSTIVDDRRAEADLKAMKEQTNEELLLDEFSEKLSMLRRRAELIDELLDGCEYQDAMFGDNLQVDGVKKLTKPASRGKKRKARQTGRYFSLAASGTRLQYDSFVDAADHRLSSRMDLSMDDLFIAETISDETKPVKLLGEWFNEREHPRDSNDGLLMMKMVSMHPVNRISDDGKYVNDESRVTFQLLPLRFFLYQGAIRFIKNFFTKDEDNVDHSKLGVSEKDKSTVEVTPAFLQRFKVFPTKLKVDYQPQRCDTAALKDGSYVELINLLPLEDMILTLQPIELINITGWGSAFSEVTRCWLRDICATQMHKFITNTSPFHPILNVGGGVAEMFLIPIEEVKEGGSLLRGLKEGTAAFAGAVAYEALNTTSKASKYAASKLSGANAAAKATAKAPVVALPARPSETPSKIGQVARHAVDSLSRGLEEANYKIIIVPCREYSRSGTTGAMRSVIRGIPVAVRAPLSGASEAVSYATLLARNAINPEKRKEEEATFKGLSSD